jgi:hypothetical protein
MTLKELGARLLAEGFRSDVYRLDGSAPPYEGLVLTSGPGWWKIEHCERGMRRELAMLPDEEAACSRMYELLTTHFRF